MKLVACSDTAFTALLCASERQLSYTPQIQQVTNRFEDMGGPHSILQCRAEVIYLQCNGRGYFILLAFL